MHHLEFSGAVRPIYGSLGVKTVNGSCVGEAVQLQHKLQLAGT